MNWLAFVEPFLKAKMALVVLLGQLFLYSLIFEHVKKHEDRLIEIALASLILWIGYGILAFAQSRTHNHDVRELERDYEMMETNLKVTHAEELRELKAEIESLKNNKQ